MMAAHGYETFSDFIRSLGYEPPERLEPGRWTPFSTNGKHSDTAGRVKLFPDGEGGIVYDWRSGECQTWQAKRGPRSDPEQRAWREKIERAQRDALAEREREAAQTMERAKGIWNAAKPADVSHAYLRTKGVKPYGLRVYGGPMALNQMRCDGALIVPARNVAGELVSLSFIAPDGQKRYLAGPRQPGCYFSIGRPDKVLCIVEGYATAASIHEATGYAVAVAFDAGNLEPTARAIRNKYSSLELVLCADDDAATPGNPGIAKATAAARAVRGLVALPEWGVNRPDGASDFNDLAQARGPDAVRESIANRRPVDALQAAQSTAPISTAHHGEAASTESQEWPELMPLVAATTSEPYPLDALPGVIGEAVREAVGFVQCPDALAACSALSAVSLVSQGLADVQRSEGLSGPSSLFVLAIAESGERKTTCDGHFLSAVREWEANQQEVAKPELAKHSAAIKAWEARREGLLSKIKEHSRKNHPSDDDERALQDLEGDKPDAPQVPRLLYGDATPEALAWKLASGWPSAGVLSSEAGIVFGGHGMKADSVMRNLALLNVLWDGGSQRVDRKQSESFTLQGARLTMGLAVQPDTVRAFLEATKGLARGTGFAARFLIAWPESTQGARPFKEPPASWPSLSAFHRRIGTLLDMPLTRSQDGLLSPSMLQLSAGAKAAWIDFHDSVEAELKPGGDMEQARDVASKAADNAARLAALFHVFEHGPTGAIGENHLLAGARIAAWHLYEARRFLGTLALPRAAVNAGKLEAWLLKRCRADRLDSVSSREVRQSGPGAVRDPKAFDEAIAELAEAGRARLAMEGKRKRIYLRPELIAEARHGA